MKPFLLLCPDPPAVHVAAALADGLRVIAVRSGPPAPPAAAEFDRESRSREFISLDAQGLERLGLGPVPRADRPLPPREFLIRGALAYAGVPAAALLYDQGDLAVLADVIRRAGRRPLWTGVRDGAAWQADLLLDLGYRSVLLCRDGGQRTHLLAASGGVLLDAPGDPPGLRSLMPRLLSGGA